MIKKNYFKNLKYYLIGIVLSFFVFFTIYSGNLSSLKANIFQEDLNSEIGSGISSEILTEEEIKNYFYSHKENILNEWCDCQKELNMIGFVKIEEERYRVYLGNKDYFDIIFFKKSNKINYILN